MREQVVFVSGVLSMAYAITALFFLRFRAQTRDRLFAWFSLAFLLLAVQRVLITLTSLGEVLYVLRLAAFLLIIVAIVEKNRKE